MTRFTALFLIILLPLQWPKVLNAPLSEIDPELEDIIEHEKNRQWKVCVCAHRNSIQSAIHSLPFDSIGVATCTIIAISIMHAVQLPCRKQLPHMLRSGLRCGAFERRNKLKL